MRSVNTVAALKALPAFRRREVERELVEPLFDRTFYASNYAEAMEQDDASDPLEHFLDEGWRRLLKPYAGFDTWWYWVTQLDPASEEINPAVHYALEGRAAGLSPNPGEIPQDDGLSLPAGGARRAILVAGYDAEFVIDDVVVLLVQELARWGDVFYLADNWLPESELAKVAPHTAGAWGIRHGAYDFGSYAMLARDLVGWDRLEGYDEVLFVNDSTFLLRPLDDVFATMSERECSWWGLQATKGLISTADQQTTRFTVPIPLDEVRSNRLTLWEQDPEYDFHVGSYFLAFRQPVIGDPIFRRLIESIHTQDSKRNVVLKYEVGLTHILLGRGHRFDTFVPAVHPLHPLFTETHFDLIAAGFPLLKRYLLAQNHYDVPDLNTWKERILDLTPEAPVDLFEAALVRTTPADRLARSMAVTRLPNGKIFPPDPARTGTYRRMDSRTQKRPDVWAFAVDLQTNRLPASSRAIFEAVKDDPQVTKVVLTRGRRVELGGTNVIAAPVRSLEGQEQLLRSGIVFVNGRSRATLAAPVRSDRQTIVAVRDGLLLERKGRTLREPRFSHSEPSAYGTLPSTRPEPPPTLTSVLAASDVDRLAALATYWPATFDQAWMTGLPAHDLLFTAEDHLPEDHREQIRQIRAETAGRRLILIAPALRSTLSSRLPPAFDERQCRWLAQWASRHDVVFGLREPERDRERVWMSQLGSFALDLSPLRFPDTLAVLRAADAVVTDYDGLALDAAITGRPVISFAYDLPEASDGLLYDLDHFFPGPVAHDFAELEAVLDTLLTPPSTRQERISTMLVDRRDDQSTTRVLAKLGHPETGAAS